MAAQDSTYWPVKNQPYRFYWRIGITGGLTSLAAKISKDGANYIATTNAPVEILDTDGTTKTGSGYVDLTASEMNISGGIVEITGSGVTVGANIVPINMTEPVAPNGAWTVAPIRLENLLMNVAAACINLNQFQGGLITLMTRSLVPMLTGNYTEQTGGDANRGQLS